MLKFSKKNQDMREDYNKPVNEQFKFNPDTFWSQPINSKATCWCCGTQRIGDYFLASPEGAPGFTDKKGEHRAYICENCVKPVLEKFIKEDSEHNPFKALYRLCAIFDFYYSDEIAHEIYESKEYFYHDGTKVPTWIHWGILYFRYIMDNEPYKSRKFSNSDNFSLQEVVNRQKPLADIDKMSDEDKRNRLQIITTFHRDVFEKEPLIERKILMADLVTMIDDSMADDFVRQQAAIEIVRTFRRIGKISEALQELQKTPETTTANSKTIKELVEQKKKETDMVTAFSKDHGFAEKYALSKSRGSGTLGAIVRDINEFGYDKGAVNKFDIETANAMRQVSDISAESIFKQLSFSESDYAQMVKEQAGIIRELRDLLEQKSEQFRLLKEKYIKQELLEEYRRDLLDKKIDEKEVDALIEEQLLTPSSFKYERGEDN